jgi:multidrug efflux pump subunit AcrA (membrane-fusion protein)
MEGRAEEARAPSRRRQSPLYLRFKLFDPDRLLGWLEPRTRLFYSKTFLWASAGLVALGIVLTAVHSREIALELPRLFRLHSALLIWLTVLAVISAHEFAHGLTCKRYGGEVREMGFMLIFFMPAFYCNVSDAWLFPEKRQRLAVIFAGAYFELVVWGASTAVWWLTAPETLPHFLALVVMAGSRPRDPAPLPGSGGHGGLRGQGALQLQPPHQARRLLPAERLAGDSEPQGQGHGLPAGALLRRSAGPPGGHGQRAAHLPHIRDPRRIYLIYGTLSGAYSTLILTAIASAAGGFLVGRLQGVGVILFILLLAFLFRSLITRLVRKTFNLLSGKEVVNVKRLLKVGLPLAALSVLMVFGRWDLKVSSPFQVTPWHNADVRAKVEGIIERVVVREGDRVEEGELLAVLSTREVEAEIGKIREQMAETEARLRLLRAGPRPEEVRVARQEVDTARTDLLQRKRELEEGEQMQAQRLKKAQVSLDKATTKLAFARQFFSLQDQLFKEGLVSKKDYLEVQEELQLREKDLEEAQEEVKLVESDKLSTLKTSLALATKRLTESEKRMELLLAGSRAEEIEAVEAELARLRVELTEYQAKKGLTRIVSPQAGVVTTPKLEEKVGELVKKGDLILEVYDFSTVVAEIEVSEKEVADVSVGLPVVLKARSFPGRTFQGRVTAVAPVAEEGDVQRLVTVRTEIENPDQLLRPGMSGNAKIVAGKRRLGELFTRRLARAVRVELWSWF